MLFQFGSGNAFGIVNTGGLLVPRKFAALQEVSVDMSFNVKELYGQQQFPLTVARGQGKISGKAKFASLNGAMLNDLFFSNSIGTGMTQSIIGETGTIPGTPFQITVANGSTFKEDLGVTNGNTGVPMTRVTGTPTTGQYAVNTTTGQYTFAAADTTVPVLIDYGYTVSAQGTTISIANLLTGQAPNFAVSIPMKYAGKQAYFKLNACVSSKLTIATKLEDFVVPDFDFSAFADAAGNIGSLSFQE